MRNCYVLKIKKIYFWRPAITVLQSDVITASIFKCKNAPVNPFESIVTLTKLSMMLKKNLSNILSKGVNPVFVMSYQGYILGHIYSYLWLKLRNKFERILPFSEKKLKRYVWFPNRLNGWKKLPHCYINFDTQSSKQSEATYITNYWKPFFKVMTVLDSSSSTWRLLKSVPIH